MNNPVNRIDPSGLDSYVFYDPNMFKDKDGVQKTQEQIEKELNDYYYGGEDKTHVIAIVDQYDADGNLIMTAAEYFVHKFNQIGRNGESIEAVVLNFHMNYNVIGFRTADNWEVSGSRLWLTDSGIKGNTHMGQINNTRAMDALVLLGCSPANTAGDDNLANSFTKKTNANMVIGADGKLWGHKKTGLAWAWPPIQSYTSIRVDADPVGFKVYWKGVGTPKGIGTKFKGIGALLDAAYAVR